METLLVSLGEPNHPNNPNFYILRCFSYLHSEWTWRLQIWYEGWS